MEQRVIGAKGKALAHVKIGIRSGWRHEVDGKRGISHFLEHAVFLGNRSHPMPDAEAARCGVILNGMINPEETLFFFTSRRDDVRRIVPLFLSLIFHPEFDRPRLKKIREEEILTATIQEREYTPWRLAEEWAANLVFDWDFRLSLGVEKDIAELGKCELTEWHKRFYHASNSFINVYGDVSEGEMNSAIENADIPLQGEVPSIRRIKWNTRSVSIKREGTRNVEIVYGFRISEYDAAWEFLRILGNHPLFGLWNQSLKKLSFSAKALLKWTATEGGFFVCLSASSRKKAEQIDRTFIPTVEDLEVDESQVELARRIRTLEILKGKDEGELTDKEFQEALDEVGRINRERVLSVGARFLNERSVVRAFVGAVD